ncbi:hypothetical protein [Edaphobacter albus]|uniref:hypothetical protein n=1 Tax=Edaphobacter sp. 4G125 TaxID=2763071 RepID=UPI001644C779|nr:hypothetical protein [Edaphobacter sp. 4G125]QNI36402.1 hypothetical protein H7846_15755 [Edaphobacter sp. 4G125]
MKTMMMAAVCFLGFAADAVVSQSAKAVPLGLWQATLDGMPGVTLTLANDAGELGGTVVFYGIDGHSQRVMVVEPHTVLRPHMEGNTLLFEMKMDRVPGGFARVKVVFDSETKAEIKCLDCGADSPTAELVKQTGQLQRQ